MKVNSRLLTALNTMPKVILLLCLLCTKPALSSQFFDPLDGQLDMSSYLSDNAYGFLPVPMIITEPAVEGGLGMVGVFFHESEDEKEQRLQAMVSADRDAQKHLLPPSVSAVAVMATGNDSWFAGGGHMAILQQGRIRYSVGGGYGDVNLDFYGSGRVDLSKPINIKTKASALMQTLKFQVADSDFFIGISQQYIDAEISPNSLGDLDSRLPPTWSQQLQDILNVDIASSGLGLLVEWDSRDNILSPYSGYYYQLKQVWFRDEIGSDLEYNLSHIEGLNYWVFNDHWRSGLKMEAEYADSEGFLPPFATPSVQLRGIPAMRYQGKFVGAAEAELIWQINHRWGINSFVGAGRASNSSASFSDAETHSAYGLGFRYQIARRYGFDMGIDIARGPEETVLYITAGSAW